MRTIQRGDLVRTSDGYLALVLARRDEDGVFTVFRGNGLETDEPPSEVRPVAFLFCGDPKHSPANFAEVLAHPTQAPNRNRNHCP